MIWLLSITGLAFALVSAAASVILWCSYASTTTDSAIAGTTAAASIACMYLFAAASKCDNLTSQTRNGMKNLTGVLLISSIAATIGWLESRHQAQHNDSLSTDYNYTTQQQQIADLTADIQNLQHSARADIANNYRARANRTQIKIDRKTEQRTQLIQQISQHQTTAGNAGQALGNNLSHLRWILWFLMALIVDACPIICFSAVAQLLQQPPETDSNTHKNPVTKPATESRKPAPELAATPETAEAEHPATNWIKQLIINGEKPATRTFIGLEFADKKLRHGDLKQIFATLEQRGIIRKNGQSFEYAGATA